MPNRPLKIVIDPIRAKKIDMLCERWRMHPHEVVMRAFEEGLDAIDAGRTKPGPTDACNLFRQWLIDARGYRHRSADTVASMVRVALKDERATVEELEAWVNEASMSKSAQYTRRTALNRWNEFCVERAHNPLELEVTELEEMGAA